VGFYLKGANILKAEETLELISKQWCDMKDLMRLSRLGINNATKLRQEIKKDIQKKGYILPKGLLPMSCVVEKLNINIDYLKKVVNNNK
jgi:hypothetical protein